MEKTELDDIIIHIGDKVMYHDECYEVKGYRTMAIRYLDLGIGFYVHPNNVDKVSEDTKS